VAVSGKVLVGKNTIVISRGITEAKKLVWVDPIEWPMGPFGPCGPMGPISPYRVGCPRPAGAQPAGGLPFCVGCFYGGRSDLNGHCHSHTFNGFGKLPLKGHQEHFKFYGTK